MSIEYEEAITRGDLDKSVDLFNYEEFNGQKIVGIFTACAYIEGKDDLAEPHIYNPQAQYMLLYYEEHVVPSTLDEIEEFKSFLEKRNMENNNYNSEKETYNVKSEILGYITANDEEKKIMNRQGIMIPQEEVTEFIERRRERFEEVGIAGFDIETYIDNERALVMGEGNCVPYLLCIRGTLMEHGRIKRDEIRLKSINEVFIGEDCCEEFVCFLINNRFYQHRNRKETGSHSEGRIKNYIFAHNGMKFDMRFIIDKIFTLLGGPTILGDVNTLKACKVKGITFLDTCLVIEEPLDEICKSFWPADESMQKFKVDTASDLEITKERYDANMAENSSWIIKMTRYCQENAHLVREIAITFFKSVYIQGYKQCLGIIEGYCFPRKMVYYSAAEMAWDIWNICFLQEDIEVCANALDIERESYRGGLVNVFKSNSSLTCIYTTSIRLFRPPCVI